MELGELIAGLPQAIILIDPTRGTVLGFNAEARRLLAPEDREIKIQDLAFPSFVIHYDKWLHFCRMLVSRGHCLLELFLRETTGRIFPSIVEGMSLGTLERHVALVSLRRVDEDRAGHQLRFDEESDLLDDQSFGIMMVRSDGEVVACNRRVLKMLGYDTFQALRAAIPRVESVYDGRRGGVGLSALAKDFGRWVERDLLKRDGDTLRVLELLRPRKAARWQDLHELYWLDIDRYRRLADELTLSREKYRVLVEHSQDGVFITHDGLYVYVNATYARMLGRSVEEMVGKPFMEFIAPEDRPRMAAMWHEREAGRWEQTAYEIRLLHKQSGKTVLASVRSGPIFYKGKLSSTGTIRDVTEERRTAEMLMSVQRDYQQIFENLHIGIFRMTTDGHLISANQAFAQLLGYDSSESLLNSVADMTAFYGDREKYDRVLETLMKRGQTGGSVWELRRRDGTPLWVLVYGLHVAGGKERSDYIDGALVDVTDRHRIEQALARSEAFYRSLVEQGHVGVFLIENGCLSYVNESFSKLLGYQADELIGLPFERTLAERNEAVLDLERCLKEQPREFEFLHADGTKRVPMLVGMNRQMVNGRTIIVAAAQDISAQKSAHETLHFQSRHDPLTGLPNRTVFRESIAERIQEARRTGQAHYTVMFLDLDGFKLVNDTLGHLAGDALLVRAAQRLLGCMSWEDILSRHGGDEFTILLGDTIDRAHIEQVISRIRESLRSPFLIHGQEIYTSASIGIAVGRPDYQDPDDVLRDADTAMYEAKKSGHGQYVFFESSMRTRVSDRLGIETELRHALANERFEVLYQPIMDLSRGSIEGCEALLRWHRQDGGCWAPDSFLDIAEDIGLTLLINRWLIMKIGQHLKSWRAIVGLPPDRFYVSLNLSHRQFFDPELEELFRRSLESEGLDPGVLRIEVTEKVVFGHHEEAQRILERLHAIGLSVALDDFGTGYSAFGYLQDLDLDVVKLDRSFIRDLAENRRTMKIVSALISLVADLGMGLVAEGVESEAQVELLKKLRCPSGQGYYFSRPLSFGDVTNLLERRVAASSPR